MRMSGPRLRGKRLERGFVTMGETKDYITSSEELGNIHISEEVLAVIAAAAALEIPGVNGLAGNLGSDIQELWGKKNLARGVHVQVAEEQVSIELSILMDYGYTIPEIGKAVQESVRTSVEAMSGLLVDQVNVSVTGVAFPPNQKQ